MKQIIWGSDDDILTGSEFAPIDGSLSCLGKQLVALGEVSAPEKAPLDEFTKFERTIKSDELT
jgi:hypothetical protein